MNESNSWPPDQADPYSEPHRGLIGFILRQCAGIVLSSKTRWRLLRFLGFINPWSKQGIRHFSMGNERETSVRIIIPVHNRRETTRSCLLNLQENGDLCEFEVCVVDDASTDGTAEMLSASFPDVEVLPGNGDLYWGGGIAAGMEHALSNGAEVMVWLNDDCLPHQGSIRILVDRVRETRGICGGVSYDPDQPDQVTYSGSRTGDAKIHIRPAADEFAHVDTLNGNLVAVHRAVTEAIGILPSDLFPHYGGDFIYCLRAHRAGLTAEIAGSATALNRRDYPLERFGASKPAAAIFREPFRTASPVHLATHWNLTREAFGFRAYPRLPFYFMRLANHYLSARRRQFVNGNPHQP